MIAAMQILIPEFMDAQGLAMLAARHELRYEPALVDDPAALLQAAPRADALIVRNRTQVRGALLQALARCRVIGRLGVGLDNIDVEACRARGIAVIPATGANAGSVAEYTVMTAMLLLRGLVGATAAVAAGDWPREAFGRGLETAGKTIGLVGFGDIGQRTARLARAVGMKPLAWRGRRAIDDPLFTRAEVPARELDALLAEADVLSINLPLSDDTRGLIDARRIALMKPGAVLVNTARGGLLDEAALADALRRRRLGGAALDVFAQEPLPASSHFQDCPNLLLTPHIAGVSVEANQRVGAMIARAVIEALETR
jgi:(S)-sulfolactate dehydrogenase